MLVIPPGGQMVTLNTQDHMYHYRAVKKRFLEAQGTFKKHCIPNPEESSNFGRWSQCANAILKRRAQAKDISGEPKVTTVVAHTLRTKVQKKAQVYVDSDLPEQNYSALSPRLMAAGGAD